MAEVTASKKPPVTPEELTVAFSGPAVFTNKMYLTLTPVTGRISFAELQPGGTVPVFRAAVCMTVNDLVELRDLLNLMLEGKLQQFDLKAGDPDA